MSLLPMETLAVPVLNFDILCEYEELCGRPITTPGPLLNMPVALAAQSVRFRLDEHGTPPTTEPPIAAKATAPAVPRQLVFDKPFLMVLERSGATQPYLALWVDNAELLVAAP